jgi:hydrogenase maturation protein HypF
MTATAGPTTSASVERRTVLVTGVVQGVGFRPFVYALARELGLSGEVSNTGDGVVVDVEGAPGALGEFCRRVRSDAPALAVVDGVRSVPLPARGARGFSIAASSGAAHGATLVPPDVALCGPCLAELTDPADRRFRHPFITCTGCGPRFTIITGLPYDRPRTTMGAFAMCPACAAEYENPADRRYHAQPVCCQDCGPELELVTGSDHASSRREAALTGARELLARGAVVAVKGIGG